jgi:hypothetical protein
MLMVEHWAEAGPLAWVVGVGSGASWSPDLVGHMTEMVYAEVLAEEGLVGFGLLMGVVFLSFRSLRRLTRMLAHAPDQRAEVAAWGGLLLVYLLVMAKGHTLLGHPYPFLLAIALGRYELWHREPVQAHAVGSVQRLPGPVPALQVTASPR